MGSPFEGIPKNPNNYKDQRHIITKIWLIPDGEEVFQKLKISAVYSTFFGTTAGLASAVIVRPKYAYQSFKVFGRTLLPIVGSFALYTLAANKIGEIRGKNDGFNHFYAGFLAGSTFGALNRSWKTAFGCGLVFAGLGLFAKFHDSEEWDHHKLFRENAIKYSFYPNYNRGQSKIFTNEE